jgi:hypothetical protein
VRNVGAVSVTMAAEVGSWGLLSGWVLKRVEKVSLIDVLVLLACAVT